MSVFDFSHIGSVAPVIGGIIIAIIGKRQSDAAEKTKATLPPYETLAQRTSDLEQADKVKGERISQLEEDLRKALGEIARYRQREKDRDQHIERLEKSLEQRDTHIERLEQHIVSQLPPPGPTRPWAMPML